MAHSGAKSSFGRTGEWRGWVLRVGLFIYLLWIPLPYGSVIGASWLPLTLPPFLLSATWLWWDRNGRRSFEISTAAGWWAIGGLSLLGIAALQIVPLPRPVVAFFSPSSFLLWERAADVLNKIEPDLVPKWISLSIDPIATARDLIGVAARLSLFLLATQLFRRTASRVALSVVLTGAATFQVVYGIRHWSGGMMEIWGWTNRLIHGRMGGTFVNPNHMAHYLALILPLSLYLLLHGWYRARREPSLQRRMERLLTRDLVLVLLAGAGLISGIFGILLAKSRGVLLALSLALVLGLALFLEESAVRRGRREGAIRQRAILLAVLVLLVVGSAVLFLGTERITGRMMPTRTEAITLVGRIDGARIALDLWTRFPLFGSGMGTFEDVALMVSGESGYFYRHAHNDWLEILATTGIAGTLLALGALVIGLRALARDQWPGLLRVSFQPQRGGSRRRFVAMGTIVIFFVFLHALVDFNFFIPANSYTFAVIAGATLASPEPRKRDAREHEG